MIAVAQKTSERAQGDHFRKANVRLELSELLLTCPGTGAWVWHLPTNTVDWSREVYRIFDAPNFDNSLESFQSMLAPDDVEAGLELVERALNTRQTFKTNIRINTPRGKQRNLLNAGRAIYDRSGKPKMIVGLVTEMAQEYAAEPNLAASLARQNITPQDTSSAIRELRDHLLFANDHPDSPAANETDIRILCFLLGRLLEPLPAKVLSGRLLRTFHSMAEVLGAERERLLEVDGMTEECVQLLEIAKLSMVSVLRPRSEPLKLDNQETFVRYLRASQAYHSKEQFRVIFLDRANHIVANEVMQEGTVDHTPVYAREVVKRALEVSATSIVLVHNHPSGNPYPSIADIELTERIKKLSLGLGISVQDHIVLGRYGHYSFRADGRLQG